MGQSCCRRRASLQGLEYDALVGGFPVRFTETRKGVVAHVQLGNQWIHLGAYGGRWPRPLLEQKVAQATGR